MVKGFHVLADFCTPPKVKLLASLIIFHIGIQKVKVLKANQEEPQEVIMYKGCVYDEGPSLGV